MLFSAVVGAVYENCFQNINYYIAGTSYNCILLKQIIHFLLPVSCTIILLASAYVPLWDNLQYTTATTLSYAPSTIQRRNPTHYLYQSLRII